MTIGVEAPSRDRLVDQAALEAAELAPQLAGLPLSAAWKRLVALESVSTIMRSSLFEKRGNGAIVDTVAVIEGLGRGGIAPGLIYALTSQIFGIQWPLAAVEGALSAEQCDRIIDGSILLCHALTEESGGSDPLSMTTAATPTEDGSYRLTGRKAYVTAAPIADLSLTFARTSPGRNPFALTAFLVPTDTRGVSRSAPFDKSALPEIPMGAIDFDDVSLPATAAVTAEGSGLALLTSTTTWERALLMSYAVGLMQRTLETAVQWTTSRTQFGRQMGQSPLTASRVADLAIGVHRVRTLVNDIAAKVDSSAQLRSLAAEAAMVKISCAHDLMEFETLAGRLFGARAVIADSGYAINTSTALAASIYAGTNDLLRISIARDLGLPVEN